MAQTALAQGEAGMYVNATWVVDEIACKYPEAVENIGAFVLPLYEDTENYTDSSLPGAIGITTACKDVEAAKRAVDFISSSKAQQIYADAQPGLSLIHIYYSPQVWASDNTDAVDRDVDKRQVPSKPSACATACSPAPKI